MISRRNFLIKSITSLVYLAISGCAKAGELSSRQNEDSGFKLSDSPNFNNLTKRFQHPAGDLNEKSFGDLFNFLKIILGEWMMIGKTLGFQSCKSQIKN